MRKLHNKLMRILRRPQRFAQDERGTHLVELAIVLPLMLMLFGATAEFGRYMYTYSTLAKATRAGARHLTTAPVNKSRVNPTKDAEARNLVVYGDTVAGSKPLTAGLSASNVQITRLNGVGTVPEMVKIEIVNFNYTPLFNLGKLTGGAAWMNVAVKPSTTMRYLLTQPTI